MKTRNPSKGPSRKRCSAPTSGKSSTKHFAPQGVLKNTRALRARTPRPKYDRLMVVALLILKEMSPQPTSLEGIGRDRAGIDMRVSSDARRRVPIVETLRYHYRKPRLWQ
ncbi:MAG: hypothetical protein ACTSXX_04170 [Candidatus Baldrarchaeia archaeon]